MLITKKPDGQWEWPLLWGNSPGAEDEPHFWAKYLPALIPLRAPFHELRGVHTPLHRAQHIHFLSSRRVSSLHIDRIPWSDLPPLALYLCMQKIREDGGFDPYPINGENRLRYHPHAVFFSDGGPGEIGSSVVMTLGNEPNQWASTVTPLPNAHGRRAAAGGVGEITLQRFIPDCPRGLRLLLCNRLSKETYNVCWGLEIVVNGEASQCTDKTGVKRDSYDNFALFELTFSTEGLRDRVRSPRVAGTDWLTMAHLFIMGYPQTEMKNYHHSIWIPYEPPTREGLLVLYFVDTLGNWSSCYLERSQIVQEWEPSDALPIRPSSMRDTALPLNAWEGWVLEGKRALKMQGKIYAPTPGERRGLRGLIGSPLAAIHDPMSSHGGLRAMARITHAEQPLTPTGDDLGYLNVELTIYPIE